MPRGMEGGCRITSYNVCYTKLLRFFNADDAKHAVTARYLYEHLFLAHLKFGTPTNEFYELVRSRTAPGEPIDLIATVRPYDDPGVERFYHRTA